MYINVLVEKSNLFFPLPDEVVTDHAPEEAMPGLCYNWSQLRLGYFYGGDGDCVLRFNAHDLAAVGRLRSGQRQVPAPLCSRAHMGLRKLAELHAQAAALRRI